MIDKKVTLSIEKGIQTRLDAVQKEITKGLEKSFKEVYGDDKNLKSYYNKSILSYALSRVKASGKPRADLRALYVKAWQNTYNKITKSYSQNSKWEDRKRIQKSTGGFAPYGLTDADIEKEKTPRSRKERLGISRRTSKYRVKYTGTGLYTGFLRESIAKGFAQGGNKFMSVSGDDTVAGYSINVDEFPKTRGESYVSQYIDWLLKKSSFSSIDQIFAFSKSDQDKIAAFMVGMMEKEFIPNFADQMADVANKVNKKRS